MKPDSRRWLSIIMDANNRRLLSYLVLSVIVIVAAYYLANVFVAFCTVNIPPNSQSTATIDSYGADHNSLRWEYTLQPPKEYIWSSNKESWAFCTLESRSLEKNIDFSDIGQVTFYVRGSIENIPLEVNIYTRKNDAFSKETPSYQYVIPKDVTVPTNWKKVTVNLSDYSVAPWIKASYPDASGTPELNNVYAFGFASKSKERVLKNNIWIDELTFVNKNGSVDYIHHFDNINTTIQGVDCIWNVGWGHL